MLLSQFRVREDARIYALIERYPWALATPPLPPGLRLASSDPDGGPVRVLR